MNNIHSTAIIGKNVIFGDHNNIGPYSIIYDGVKIGNNNSFGPHTIIGCDPTDSKQTNRHIKNPCVFIGDNNIIREFCIIEKPCYEEYTQIKNDVFLMQGVHVSHDNIIENNVVITNSCVIGGIAKILEGSDLGMGCTINQYSIIGQYSIVATGAACMKNVKPFSRYIPNKPISVNLYAIKKYGFLDYEDEISKYVIENQYPTTKILKNIIEYFDLWVMKYGHQTY